MFDELRHDELIRLELQVIAERAIRTDCRPQDSDLRGRRRRSRR